MSSFQNLGLRIRNALFTSPDHDTQNPDLRLQIAEGHTPVEVVRTGSAPTAGMSHLISDLANINAELAGFGPQLAPLIQDPSVTDILINGPSEVWVDSGSGLNKLG